jgi:hypothetical protein
MRSNLSPEDFAAIVSLLRGTITAAPFSLSPSAKRWRAILGKLEAPGAGARPVLLDDVARRDDGRNDDIALVETFARFDWPTCATQRTITLVT